MYQGSFDVFRLTNRNSEGFLRIETSDLDLDVPNGLAAISKVPAAGWVTVDRTKRGEVFQQSRVEKKKRRSKGPSPLFSRLIDAILSLSRPDKTHSEDQQNWTFC